MALGPAEKATGRARAGWRKAIIYTFQLWGWCGQSVSWWNREHVVSTTGLSCFRLDLCLIVCSSGDAMQSLPLPSRFCVRETEAQGE